MKKTIRSLVATMICLTVMFGTQPVNLLAAESADDVVNFFGGGDFDETLTGDTDDEIISGESGAEEALAGETGAEEALNGEIGENDIEETGAYEEVPEEPLDVINLSENAEDVEDYTTGEASIVIRVFYEEIEGENAVRIVNIYTVNSDPHLPDTPVHLVIPSEIKGKPVVEIDGVSIGYFTGDLVIPDGVKKIGKYAFSQDPDADPVFTGALVIPDSVEYIGEKAFSGNKGFTSLTIGSSVETIDKYAFANCYGLTGDLIIPDSVETIGERAFYGCTGIRGDITIGNGVETIGDYAFYGGFAPDSEVTTGTLTIGNSVETIGEDAFDSRHFTGDLTIPGSVETIGNYAFAYNAFTGRLTIENGVKKIGESAFRSGGYFTGSLIIPDSVIEIGEDAFNHCEGFTGNLKLPAGLEEIKKDAFLGCTGFTGNLVIPSGVKKIGEMAFYNCDSFDGALAIPASVESIGNNAFSYVRSIRLVSNLSNIDFNLPAQNSNLEYIVWVNKATGEQVTAIKQGTAALTNAYEPVGGDGITHLSVDPQTYTGSPITPAIDVYHGTKKLEPNKDYSVKFSNNTMAGMATFTITGKGSYAGKDEDTFKIEKKDIGAADVTVSAIAPLKYNKKVQSPVPAVTYNKKKLKNKTDFDVVYHKWSDADNHVGEVTNPKDPGKYWAVLNGKGNFKESNQTLFMIVGADETHVDKLKAKISDKQYTGSAIALADGDIEIKNGSRKLDLALFNIQKNKIYDNAACSGEPVSPVDVGTYYFKMSAKDDGDYVGERVLSFKVVGTPLGTLVFENFVTNFTYTGSPIEQDTLIIRRRGSEQPLRFETDYDYDELTDEQKKQVECIVSYGNTNKNVGTASLTVTGVNGYTGSVKKTFKINPFDIKKNYGDAFKVVKYNKNVSYVKSGAKAEVETVTFNGAPCYEGVDFTVSYLNNKAVNPDGSGKNPPTVKITGKGNFKGIFDTTKTVFKIQKGTLGSKVTIVADDVVWADKIGNWKTKKITVTDKDGNELKPGTDYDRAISFIRESDNKELADGDKLSAGETVKIIIKGTGNYSNTSTAYGTYRIDKQDIGKFTATISPQVYTGNPVTITAKDIKWTYKNKPVEGKVNVEIVSYKNNIQKGKATVIVKGNGDNCCGRKAITFTIGSRDLKWWWSRLF